MRARVGCGGPPVDAGAGDVIVLINTRLLIRNPGPGPRHGDGGSGDGECSGRRDQDPRNGDGGSERCSKKARRQLENQSEASNSQISIPVTHLILHSRVVGMFKDEGGTSEVPYR